MTPEEIPVHESTRKRRRWGCTCGCLVVVLLLLFVLLGVTVWMVRPLRTQPQTSWIDPSVDGFGVLNLSSDDDGMAEFTEYLLKRIATRIKQQAPEKEQKAVAASTTVARKSVTQFVNPEVILLLSPDTANQESALAAVQLKNRLATFLASIYLNDKLPVAEQIETTGTAPAFFRLGGSATSTSPTLVALAGRTLMLSDSVPMILRATDKAGSRTPSQAVSDKLQPYIDALALDQPAPGRDLAFAVVTPPGRILSWLRSLEKSLGAHGMTENLETALASRKVSLDEVQGITLSGDMVSGDQVNFTATLYGKRIEAARKLADALRLSLNQILSRVEGAALTSGLTTKLDVKPLGTSIVVGLQVSGLQKVIERLVPLAPPAPKAPAHSTPAAGAPPEG